jgi:hypothetical protein
MLYNLFTYVESFTRYDILQRLYSFSLHKTYVILNADDAA